MKRLRYDYDALGNLRWRHDQRRGELESFGYDALNRLRSTHVGLQGLGAPAVLAMTYDALGNICTKQTGSSVASYQYRGRAGCAG
ncbi:hypothetical protein, partial [Aquimonas sp.]|uniref:hypothetical protein n=1 Tax=Aquimonas sp. TaxID=1872588 RepID=UPI0037BE6742